MTANSLSASAHDVSVVDVLLADFVALLLALQLFTLATYNVQPEHLRVLVSAMSFLGYAALVVIALVYGRPSTFVHLLGLALFCTAALLDLVIYPGRASPSQFIERVTSPMLLGFLTMRPLESAGPRVLWVLWGTAVVSTMLAAAQAFHGTPVVEAGIQRLAVFAGGEEGVHPSAYATACLFLTLLVLWRARVGPNLITLPVLGLLVYMLYKYEVRTVWLMLAAFAGFSLLYWSIQRSMSLVVAGVGAALLAVAAILFIVANSGFDFAHFSSGRTLIYAERLQVITGRRPLELFFGSGSGTDLMRGVSAWRWAQKNSHNDFLIITVEFGLVGLLGFLLMITAPIAGLPAPRKGWIIMIITSSLVSNGVLVRPSIGAPMILIGWLSLALYERALANAPRREEWRSHELQTPGAFAPLPARDQYGRP